MISIRTVFNETSSSLVSISSSEVSSYTVSIQISVSDSLFRFNLYTSLTIVLIILMLHRLPKTTESIIKSLLRPSQRIQPIRNVQTIPLCLLRRNSSGRDRLLSSTLRLGSTPSHSPVDFKGRSLQILGSLWWTSLGGGLLGDYESVQYGIPDGGPTVGFGNEGSGEEVHSVYRCGV